MPVAAIGLAISAYSAYSQGQQAKEALKDRNRNLSSQQDVFAEDKAYYRKKFGPVNDMLIDYVMGNKQSPALAQGLSTLEQGYGVAQRKMAEIQARQSLGQSGIGEGQEIGLGLSEAKAKAGLMLSDQAERFQVAKALGSEEGRSQLGTQGLGHAYGVAAGYNQRDYEDETARTGQLWGQAGRSLAAGMDYMYGAPEKKDAGITAVENPKPIKFSGGQSDDFDVTK